MHMNLRVHHWVIWWFGFGIVCGAVEAVNILADNLTRTGDKIALILGLMFWTLGGLVCYALDGIQVERTTESRTDNHPAHAAGTMEWHPASDFLLPGDHHTILPPRR